MKYGDIELSVKIGEDSLEEYDTVIKDNEVTCWIASEGGKNFTILCINDSQHQAVRCAIEIDGRDAEAFLLPSASVSDERGIYTGSDTVLLYTFSDIQLSDDDTLRDRYPRQSVDHLGTIRIVIHRIKLGEVLNRDPWPVQTVPQAIGPVHERMKKGGAHCVSLGKQVKVVEQDRREYTDLDGKDKPHCVFLFRYRSKDILQAQGIIPLVVPPRAPPQGTPLSPNSIGEADRHPAASKKRARHDSVKEESGGEDNEDEVALQAQVAAAAARLQHIEAKMAKMKDKKRQKRVKREVSPIQITGGNGGIIDLTSD